MNSYTVICLANLRRKASTATAGHLKMWSHFIVAAMVARGMHATIAKKLLAIYVGVLKTGTADQKSAWTQIVCTHVGISHRMLVIKMMAG
jgi:hypothetical protein